MAKMVSEMQFGLCAFVTIRAECLIAPAISSPRHSQPLIQDALLENRRDIPPRQPRLQGRQSSSRYHVRLAPREGRRESEGTYTTPKSADIGLDGHARRGRGRGEGSGADENSDRTTSHTKNGPPTVLNDHRRPPLGLQGTHRRACVV